MTRLAADAESAQLSLFSDDAGESRAAPTGAGPGGTRHPAASVQDGAAAPASPAGALVPAAGAAVGASNAATATAATAGVTEPARFAHPRAQRELLLGGHRVAYEFRRARRRSIGFVVGPEGLSVSAPRWVGLGEVEAALHEKSRWILRKLHDQQERARRLQQARIEWRDGTAIPFLGETVIVVVDPRAVGTVLHKADGVLPGVPRLTLHVGLPQGAAAEQLREAVQSWLQRQARGVFEERCADYAARLGVRVRRLSLSSASTRWGSASADGSIRLNWRLIHFGLATIDYVVAHELAHLREMNHSPRFWDVVRSVIPDVDAARDTLRSELLSALD